MISLEELNEIKEKKKTGLYYAEKEYLQYIFLNAISKYSENFIFKGGTCLRICYGLERASEDLDFSTNLPLQRIKEIVKKCLQNFELLNIPYKIYAEREFKNNLRIEVRFQGPLYKGKSASTNTLKVDFNMQKTINKSAKVVSKLFSDVPLFTILVLNEKEVLAEKIRALVNRKQPRDLYDVWMLINKGVEIDKNLIEKKLKEEKGDLKRVSFPSKEEYERDLKSLVHVLPPYEQVKKEAEHLLESLKSKLKSKID